MELYSCPKNIAQKTSSLFFSDSRITILTSATMTNQKIGTDSERYSYFVRNTGFPDEKDYGFLSPPKPSPFPYDEHSKIFYASNLPNPRTERDKFIEEGTKVVIDLINLTKGKALILFTAKSDMESVYQKLLEANLPYEIMTQSEDSSQEETLTSFKININSVLLGTGAYWEGINIEGESLSNLIIFRLPFPVPDPIIEYKCSIEDDALMKVNVPIMIIKLNQGIGRLIRSNADKGIVSIIDPRLSDNAPSKYKDIVWESLPIKNKTNSFAEIERFYHSLND